MSIGNHYVTNRHVVAIETEATPGTAEALVEGDVHSLVGNAAMSTEFERIENELSQATLSEEPDFQGTQEAEISFMHYLKGSGTADAPPDWAEFLKHAGFAEAIDAGVDVEYTPDSNFSTNPATIGIFNGRTSSGNALRRLAKGCRAATMTITIEPGQVPRIEWTWRGAFAGRADAAGLTTAANYHDGAGLDTTQPQRATGVNLSIGAWSPNFRVLTVTVEWELTQVEDADDDSGICGYEVVSRMVTGELQLYTRPVSEKDVIADIKSAGTAAFSATIGATAGNIVEITGPAVQLADIDEGDESGLMSDTIALKFTGDAGDDEIKITTK